MNCRDIGHPNLPARLLYNDFEQQNSQKKKMTVKFCNLLIYCKVHIHSEKATKSCKISTLLLTTVHTKLGGDFAKFCGLLRIYELYQHRKASLRRIQAFYLNISVLVGAEQGAESIDLGIQQQHIEVKSFLKQYSFIMNLPLDKILPLKISLKLRKKIVKTKYE